MRRKKEMPYRSRQTVVVLPDRSEPGGLCTPPDRWDTHLQPQCTELLLLQGQNAEKRKLTSENIFKQLLTETET